MSEKIKQVLPGNGSFRHHLSSGQKEIANNYRRNPQVQEISIRGSQITYNVAAVEELMIETGLPVFLLVRELLNLPNKDSVSIDPRGNENVVKEVNARDRLLVIKDSTKAGKRQNQAQRYTGESQINIGSVLGSEISRVGMGEFLRVVDIYAAVTKDGTDYQVMEKITGMSFDQLATNIKAQAELPELSDYLSILRESASKLKSLLQSSLQERNSKIEKLSKEIGGPVRFLQDKFGINKDFFREVKYDIRELQARVAEIESFLLALKPFDKKGGNISDIDIRNLSFVVQEYIALETIIHPNVFSEISKGAWLNSPAIKGDNLMIDLGGKGLVVVDPTPN